MSPAVLRGKDMNEDKNINGYPKAGGESDEELFATQVSRAVSSQDYSGLSDSIQQEMDTFTRSLNQQVGAINMDLRMKNEIVPADQSGNASDASNAQGVAAQNSANAQGVAASGAEKTATAPRSSAADAQSASQEASNAQRASGAQTYADAQRATAQASANAQKAEAHAASAARQASRTTRQSDRAEHQEDRANRREDRANRQENRTKRRENRASRKTNRAARPASGSRQAAPFLLHKPSKVFHHGRLWASGIVGLSMLTDIGDAGDDLVFDLAIIVFCLFVFVRTIMNNGLIKRFYLYSDVIGNRDHITTRKLASALGTSKEKVLKDLRKFKNKGWLPQGVIDEAGKNLLLTDEAVLAYEDAVARRNDLDARTEKAMTDLDAEGISPEVRAMLEDGQKFLKDIRRANDEIPDENMSGKLYALEDIVARIFDHVKKHPENAGELSRFMAYYVPTTRKLMNAYVELDRQPDVGSNITDTRKQIEDAMDTVIQACQSLLNTMFQDVAADIATDISVLKSMASRDGLTKGEGDAEGEIGPLKF